MAACRYPGGKRNRDGLQNGCMASRGRMQGLCIPLGTSGVEEGAGHWTPTALPRGQCNLHLREEADGAAVVAC